MSFTLDTSKLGAFGASYDEQTLGDRGRGISIEWQNFNVDEDFTHFGFAIRYFPAEDEPKETP